MKFLVILACLVAFSSALSPDLIKEFVTKLKSIADKCVPETNASKDDVASLIAHKVPASHEGKCLLFCFHRNLKMQNDDGSVNHDGMMALMEPVKADDPEVHGKLMKIYETCSAQVKKDDDPCMFAANIGECAVREGKALGLDELVVIE